MNRVTIAGRLAQEPEIQTSAGGKEYLQNGLAIRGYDGETIFINFVAFAKTMELIEQYLSKGSTVIIEGRLSVGEKSRLSVIAERVEFVSSGKPKDTDDEYDDDEDDGEEYDDYED